jgi:hypothetical protein
VPLPKLSNEQVEGITEQVAAYIDRQRQTYIRRTAPLDPNQMAAMRLFFPASVVDSTGLVILTGERVSNPPFYGELMRMGFAGGSLPDFAHMAAITFVDTVVSHGPVTNRVLFHELVHVVQYEKLGLPQFAAKYFIGFLSGGAYEAIPLERNAYELDARFSLAPAAAFSVETEVQSWIQANRF